MINKSLTLTIFVMLIFHSSVNGADLCPSRQNSTPIELRSQPAEEYGTVSAVTITAPNEYIIPLPRGNFPDSITFRVWRDNFEPYYNNRRNRPDSRNFYPDDIRMLISLDLTIDRVMAANISSSKKMYFKIVNGTMRPDLSDVSSDLEIYGLSKFDSSSNLVEEFYWEKGPNGEIENFISCNKSTLVKYPMCNHSLYVDGVYVSFVYQYSELSEWRNISLKITDLITCFTEK